MADHLFSFRVLSPLGTAFEGMAKSATLPTPDGEITILAHHMPLVAVLTDGEVRIDTGKKVVFIAVAGGFLETGKAAAHVPGTTLRCRGAASGQRRQRPHAIRGHFRRWRACGRHLGGHGAL